MAVQWPSTGSADKQPDQWPSTGSADNRDGSQAVEMVIKRVKWPGAYILEGFLVILDLDFNHTHRFES